MPTKPEAFSRFLIDQALRESGWDLLDDRRVRFESRRQELDRMMADAHKRRFDIVAVWKFNRFARSVSHLLRALDTATPAGRMVFAVLGAVAELERSLIVERVKAGLRNARAKGKRLGRPRVTVDARRIATLRKSGAPWATICRQTGLSKGTAQRALHSLPKNDLRFSATAAG